MVTHHKTPFIAFSDEKLWDLIFNRVAEHYGLSVDELRSRNREEYMSIQSRISKIERARAFVNNRDDGEA